MALDRPGDDLHVLRAEIERTVGRDSREFVVLLDAETRVVSVDGNTELLPQCPGRVVDEMEGWPVLDLVHPDDRPVAAERLARVRRGIDTGGTELRIGTPGGPYRHVVARGRPVGGGDTPIRFVVLFQDIQREKAIELELRHATSHDPLTGLPNRSELLDALLEVEHRADVAVVVVNLDRFRYVNEGLGSQAGDRVLQVVADRLRSVVGDDLVVRLGSDEFGIVRGRVSTPEATEAFATAVRAAVHAPIELGDGTRIQVDCSVGAALACHHDDTGHDLFAEAIAATSAVKDSGRGGVLVSEGRLRGAAEERVRLEQDLRRAVDRGELEVHYQPQVDHRTGQIVSVEALVRWHDPQRGWVGPGQFLPIAEESQLIVQISDAVLAQACTDAARWRAGGLDLGVAVNVAARQLLAPTFAATLERCLATSGLDADALTLEVTETTLFADHAAAQRVLDRVRASGVHLALDDFGTGYSSLLYLRRFNVEKLKIDKSFVQGIGTSPEDENIIRGIVQLGTSLDLDLVAEGVETAAQADWLVAAGCPIVQGFLYSRALPADGLRRWVADEKR